MSMPGKSDRRKPNTFLKPPKTRQPSVVAMGMEYSLSLSNKGSAISMRIWTYPTGILQTYLSLNRNRISYIRR
ncbi:unnamed protein product [Linum trigynum]